MLLRNSVRRNQYGILLIFFWLLVACSASNRSSLDFNVGLGTDFSSISPYVDRSAESRKALRNLHAGLYYYNAATDTLELGLAESITENDELSFSVRLRPNLVFHNGTAIEASDVAYSLKRVMGLIDGIPNLNNELYKQLGTGDITVIDTLNLRLRLDKKFATSEFFYLLEEVPIVPEDYSEEKQRRDPVGAGAYRFISYYPGELLELQRFNKYYRWNLMKKPGNIERVLFHIIPDFNSEILAYQGGDLDILNISNARIEERLRKDPENSIHYGYSNDIRTLQFNLREKENGEKSPVMNPLVREALAHATNKEALNETLSQGAGTVLNSHFSPALKFYFNSDIITPYPYNPEVAREKLKQAGYTNSLKLKVRTISENTIDNDLILLIQQQWKEAGITLEIEPISWNRYLQEVYYEHDFELTMLTLTGYPNAYGVLKQYTSDDVSNLSGWINLHYDELIQEVGHIRDKQKQKKLYYEAQEILAEKLPALYLLDVGSRVALKKVFSGYSLYPFPYVDVSMIYREEDN